MIRGSHLGLDFPRERFLTLPEPTIRALLSHIAEHEQRRANEYSSTAATLTWMVHTYLSMQGENGKAPDTTAANYLPYPDLELKDKDEESLLEPQTKEILIHLLKSRQLPPHIYNILVNPPSSKKGGP